jgi:hypothetical protein
MKNKDIVANYYNHLILSGTRSDIAIRKTAKAYKLTTSQVRRVIPIKPNKAIDQRNTLIKYLSKEIGLGTDEIGTIIKMSPVYVKRLLK